MQLFCQKNRSPFSEERFLFSSPITYSLSPHHLSPIAYFSSHNVVHLAIADNVDVAILHDLDNCGSLLWSFDIIYPSWRVVHADDTPCAR